MSRYNVSNFVSFASIQFYFGKDLLGQRIRYSPSDLSEMANSAMPGYRFSMPFYSQERATANTTAYVHRYM